MRLTLLIIFLNSAFCFTQKAEFFCSNRTYKFPVTKEGAIIQHTYKVYNKGKAPFQLLNYDVECSCTSVDIEKEQLQPGDSSFITVTFNTEGRVFYQDRVVKLFTSIRKKPYLLRFKVKVIPKPS
ncbi:MAG: DUF1573 domain-containing protein [Crocinitomicaceae bacterium]|nr:DUF1573 domain-containing protein [Crocinitomicaceae bacterium]